MTQQVKPIHFDSLGEVIEAVKAGKKIYWASLLYDVIVKTWDGEDTAYTRSKMNKSMFPLDEKELENLLVIEQDTTTA